MIKASKIFTILGIVVSLASIFCFFIGMYIINVRVSTDSEVPIGKINVFLYSAFFWSIIILILSFVSLTSKSKSKSVPIAGLVICFIGVYQTYGITLVAGVGFVLNLINISNQEMEYEKSLEALPDEERVVVHNNDINFRYKHVDYKSYVKKNKINYIISIILSTIYIAVTITLTVLLTNYLINKYSLEKVGLGIIGIIFLVFFLYAIIFFLVITEIIGLVAPILALACPNRTILKVNSVIGFICLTFLNASASANILKDIDWNINKSIRQN